MGIMKTPIPCCSMLILSILLCTVITPCNAAEAELPNVMLITMDTTRADHLGCYGYTRDTSPNIDRFAQDAVVFKNAVSVIPLTTPSHTSIMTGLHP